MMDVEVVYRMQLYKPCVSGYPVSALSNGWSGCDVRLARYRTCLENHLAMRRYRLWSSAAVDCPLDDQSRVREGFGPLEPAAFEVLELLHLNRLSRLPLRGRLMIAKAYSSTFCVCCGL